MLPPDELPDPPELSPEVAAVRAELLSRGVVVVEEADHEGAVVVTAPREEVAAEAVAELLPGRRAEWLGRTPRELRCRRSIGWRDVGGHQIKVWLPFQGDEHLDEIVSAEDDGRIVVLAMVCTPRAGAVGRTYVERFRVTLEAPAADRVVIDGFSGEPLEPW